MSWYKKGDEGKARSVEEEAAAKARAQASQNPSRNRFWLAPNKSAKVTFLDSEGFFFREHQLYLNGLVELGNLSFRLGRSSLRGWS